jgi:hypothetical protein
MPACAGSMERNMLFPKLVPAGASYVKIPNSKRATMRILLETVQRGSRYWLSGTVSPDKALGFADKMAKRYRTDANQAQRAYAKSKGLANTTLVMFPEDISCIRWWLLVTPGQGPVHTQESLLDSHDKRTRLRWDEQYELVHEQRTRNQGGGYHWTWRMTDSHFAALSAAMQQQAASPGRHPHQPPERQDDLDALVQALMRMPGFQGVRQQVMELLWMGKQVWQRTHHQTVIYSWPDRVSYLDKSFACYHSPEPMRLDVLARCLSGNDSVA